MPKWQLTTEVNIFAASNGFQNDPTICTPALQIVMENGAHSPCYYGVQIEDPSTGYNFVNWDSHQAHMDVTDNPEIFPDLQAALRPSLVLPPTITMYHVIFSDDPATGFTQPYTQVTKLDLQQPPFPETREAMKAILSEVASKIGEQFVFGPTYEDGNTYIVICGQTSAEGFWEDSSDTELAPLIQELFNLAKKDFDIHTALSLYAKAA
ncbi:hypothetical protein JVU11DRAFT_11588 [Chiua virens]|nr:hypothetical protein JVU11DRAFT_11588 [Chiua virens]